MIKNMKITTFIRKVYRRLHLYGWFNFLPDALDIKLLYLAHMGKLPNLKKPQTFNEKLNWLKLNDHNPLYTTLVDKYAVKEWVAKKIGEQYVIPTLGVWNNFDDIDFSKLPNQFVLKCTHDSAGLIICKDKSQLDKKKARNKLSKCLKRNFYYIAREWPYKHVPPRIIAEQYMEDIQDGELRDYKFYTFNGEPKFILIASNRHIKEKKRFDYFDMDFNHIDLQDIGIPNSAINYPHKPKNFELMKKFCRILAKDIPAVRVDFYEVNGQLYFGEMTFFDNGGFMQAKPTTWEKEWGDLIDLSTIKKDNSDY